METNESNKKFLPAAVLVAGVLIAGAVIWNGSHPVHAPTETGTAPKDIKDVKTAGNLLLASQCPVTIAFWSDFSVRLQVL